MARKLGWRAAIVAALIIGAFIYLTPSLSSDLPAWWSSFLPRDKIHLGLDLQGGMHLVLEVDAKKAVESHLERVVEDLRHDLRRSQIRYLDLKRSGTEGVDLVLMREEDTRALENLAKTDYPDFKVDHVTKMEKGFQVALTLGLKAKDHIMKMASEQALEGYRTDRKNGSSGIQTR